MTIALPQLTGQNVVTHSRSACYKSCGRKHWFRYELGIRAVEDTQSLRFGKAMHAAIEAMSNGKSVECDDWSSIEAVAVYALALGYQWYWGDDKHPANIRIAKTLATEFRFQVHVSDSSGKRLRKVEASGSLDAIVELADGRLAIRETKTARRVDDNYWSRLDRDEQISLYTIGARHCGYDVQTVLYDVVLKPDMDAPEVNVTDDDGVNIVLDIRGERVTKADGGWRTTGDATKGYTVQRRPMTMEEFYHKLWTDITTNPSAYYQRREIPRLDADLTLARDSFYAVSKAILDGRKAGTHYTNTQSCYAYGSRCEYAAVCINGLDRERLPDGFVAVDNVHQELR